MGNQLPETGLFQREGIEEELRRQSAFNEALIVSAAEGLCVWHSLGEYPYAQFTVWNPAMEEITGYSMEEINRLGWAQTLFDDPATQKLVMEDIKSPPHGHARSRLERSIIRADGVRRIVVISSSPIQSEKGRDHVIAWIRDVTKLKEAERALWKSEARFRTLLEHIRVGILVVEEGRVVYQNPEQDRILGGRLSAPYPLKTLADVVRGEDRSRFEALCGLLPTKDPVPSKAVVRLVPPEGRETDTPRWVSCRCSAIECHSPKTNLIHMLDITQFRDLERCVMQQEKMASLGHVAAGIAHEIRNPLSGINVYLDAIRDNFQDTESCDEVLQLITEAQATSNKIETVIKRVLDFARPSELKLRPTSVKEAIHEALKLLAPALRKAAIDLELDFASDLLPVYGDLQLLEQVFLNLISNASMAMSSVQGERRIRISTFARQGNVFIQIEDSGPGIPLEMRDRVFDPFFTSESHGMGIGLGICRRIISDHRGEIAIADSPLGGAQFNIVIPIEKRKRNT